MPKRAERMREPLPPSGAPITTLVADGSATGVPTWGCRRHEKRDMHPCVRASHKLARRVTTNHYSERVYVEVATCGNLKLPQVESGHWRAQQNGQGTAQVCRCEMAGSL